MNLKKKIRNGVAQGRGDKCVDSALNAESSDNSVLGMQFRTCGNFRTSTDSSLVESPKISTNTKATPQFLEFASEAKQPSLPLRFCETQNLGENQTKIAESRLQIGIVIPIYNVAKYLRECLDSVANQTYGNFCAVLVNDGSTDDSKQIALDFVAKDARFVLIDKENGGLSSARNAGINYFKSVAKGAESSKQIAESALDSATIHTHKNTTPNPPKIDYIIFLDSDDFWEVDLLQTCIDSAKSQNLDIVWFGWKTFYENAESINITNRGGAER